MFQEAVEQNREAIYAILAHTTNNGQKTVSSASGFMISPSIVATVAHVLFRKDNDLHEVCEVIRAPDME